MNQNRKFQKNSSPFHIVKYVTGWASGGSGASQTHGQATAVIDGGSSFLLNKSRVEFLTCKIGIFTPEFIAFSVFSFVALFFNILVYSITAVPVAPKIICGVMFAATFIPVVVSLARSPRRAVFKLNSSEFIALYFESRAKRQEFLQYFEKFKKMPDNANYNTYNTFDEYDADITWNMFDGKNEKHKSNAKVKAENGKIKITTGDGKTLYTDFFLKSHDKLWELYPFASVFIVMPIFAIVSSLQSGKFESAILFTLIFTAAGLLIMFVPSIISRGKLLLFGRDGYVCLEFLDSKTRNKFEKEIKQQKSKYKAPQDFTHKGTNGRTNDFKIFNTDKFYFPVGLVIATVVYLAVIVGLITSLNLIAILIGTYMGFVFYSFFFIFYKDMLRQDLVIWLRRKRLEDSDLITAEITDCKIKDFLKGKRYFFNVDVAVKYTEAGGEHITKVFSKEGLYSFPDYRIGQKVVVAVSGATVSLLIDSSFPILSVPDGSVNLHDDIINQLKSVPHRSVDTSKPYRIFGQQRLVFIAYALSFIPLGGLTVFFLMLMLNGADSATMTIGTVLFVGIVALFLGFVVNFIAKISKLLRSKSIVKNGVLTKGYILHLHTVKRVHRSGDSERITYTYYFKFAYFNGHGELTTGYADETFYTNFSNYGLPDLHARSFIDICTLNGDYALLQRYREL